MKQLTRIWNNIQALRSDEYAIIAGAICFGGILYLGLTYTNMEQMIGNLGPFIAWTSLISHWIVSLLFGLFVTATIYKVRWMNHRAPQKASTGVLGGIISTIIVGCPSCSISIASYLGLGSILINLPAFGVEIKIIGLLILGRATWNTLINLFVCQK